MYEQQQQPNWMEKMWADRNAIDPENPPVEMLRKISLQAFPAESPVESHESTVLNLLAQQNSHLGSIRKMLRFFVTLTCMGLAAGIITWFITTAP